MNKKQSKKGILISVTILVLLIFLVIFFVLSTKNKRIISKLEAISKEKENTSNYSYTLPSLRFIKYISLLLSSYTSALDVSFTIFAKKLFSLIQYLLTDLYPVSSSKLYSVYE